eukprot:gnl/TRDRNA2_/TRDRNA2_191080_c0_seq1.p1 gnl/TRDRNA2_/TRDRNA2_191080_c0~~gnl/TRDRNA2_/TRDRNA2_191080_c0_seq1.p1  ORF type:complete len:690 (-),score=133.61 gnl/TRDRNA2_/TRDRNA2_191080_c0_seq1:68-2029(-)
MGNSGPCAKAPTETKTEISVAGDKELDIVQDKNSRAEADEKKLLEEAIASKHLETQALAETREAEREEARRRQEEHDLHMKALQEEKAKLEELRLAEEERQRKSQALKDDQEQQENRKQWEQSIKDRQMGIKKAPTLGGARRKPNRYGPHGELPAFDPAVHIPTLGLLNPLAGAKAGRDILDLTRQAPYYQNRFFDIIEVVKDQKRGGLMDVFRIELTAAKEEAKARKVRPRLISGGGDGTASFALWMVFKTLKAQPERDAFEGCVDTGNGFIWTDQELEDYFPALAQLPLGSANDFGNILGWGQKYPGDPAPCPCQCGDPLKALHKWFSCVISPNTAVVNFDLWGLMPEESAEKVDFKIAELTGPKGWSPRQSIDGKKQLVLKEAGKPVPFFVCLYFSVGFGAYMVARFQLNRHGTPLTNRIEYVRQGAGILFETTPPQLNQKAEGVSIDCENQAYFPPRRDKGNRGKNYREVGFLNINWQAHLQHGADRAPLMTRLCCGKRTPVTFNDGLLDMYRSRIFATTVKNPGPVLQTDKKKDMTVTFTADKGKGIFFQYDGESRFAFSPEGKPFTLHVRKILNIAVVLGPYLQKSLVGDIRLNDPVKFQFCGENEAQKEKVRKRIFASLGDDLEAELNATKQDMQGAKLPCATSSD